MTTEDPPRSGVVWAAIWMVGAITSFSLMAIAGRVVRTELDTFELMTYRSVVGFFIVVTIAIATGALGQLPTRRFGLHLLRNVSHFTGQNLWFFALATVPLAQLISLEFSTPVWVVILAPLLLGETLSRLKLVTALVGFVGVLIVANPNPANFRPDTLAAALAALGFAGSAIFTKRLTRTESTICIMFWLTLMQFVMGFVISFHDFHMTVPTFKVIPAVIAVGLAGLTAHFCLTTALRAAPASIVMPIDFLRLPTMALIGWALYGETLTTNILLGAAVILLANYVSLRAEATQRARAARAA